MIRSIIGASLRFWMLLIAIAVGVLVVGFVQLRSAPVDVLPEFTPPYVEVQTEALGLSANEVEQLITVPLEADLLNGVEGVEVIRSESVAGLSDVVLVFKPGTDLYQARQLVQERLIQAHALPQVSQPPTMINPMSSASRIMMIGIDPNKLSTIEAGVLSHWVIRPRLSGVPGVSNVSIWGLRDQQLQVQVDPAQLQAQGVTLNQVVETTGNAQLVSPLTFLEASTPGTGGFIETPNQRLQVRHVFENFGTPEDLGKVTVEDTGGQLRVADVANVVEEHQPLIGDAVVGGNDDRLLLVVEKFPGADTVEVTSAVEDALGDLQPGLSGMKFDADVFQPASYITDAIGNLRLAIIIASVLLALVLAAFLFSLRATLISLVTIPLSLMVAALVLYFRGETFNPIAFAGLAVAIAIIVDDAVIGVHNVARHLGEHHQADEDDRSTAGVVLEALSEVRRPATYAAFIALLVIVPVVVMEGRPGTFFEPLALSYVLAVLASMVVALTVAPALSMLAYSRGSRVRRESPILRLLNPLYDGILSRLVRAPRAMLIAAAACVVVGLAALPFLNTSLVPSFKDNDMLVNLQGPPGTSEPKMSGMTAQLSRELGAIPGVEDVGGHVGRALTGDQIVDVNSSTLSVKIGSDADYDATVAEIEDVVGGLDETVDREVVTSSQQEVNDVGTLTDSEAPGSGNNLDVLTGADKPLVVRVYGQGLDTLRSEADDVRDIVGGVDGVLDPQVEAVPEEPVLAIETDLARAEPYGIKPGDVRRASAMLLQGVVVGNIFGEQKVFEVVVKGVPKVRESVENVRNVLIDTPDGGHVRLEQVADVSIKPSPAVIKRDAAQRYVDVEANITGRSLDAVATDVEERLADSQFPLEYHAEVLGQTTTAQEINLWRVVGFSIAALITIFLLFQAAFRSWRLAGLAFLTLPVALVGGVLAALIDGATLSLGALIAFLALLGIAARNGVMLIDRLQRLRLDEAFGAELIRRGAQERFAPTLTVAVATAAVVLPFVILGNVAGLEIVNPMAIVMLGGLLTSTLLALFVLPVLYLSFGGGAEPEPLAETPGPHGAATEPVAGDREVAPQPARSRQFERAPGRANAAAYQEGEGGSQGKRGE
ncbi:MAG: Cobalt-zinc-cadmium resistance protein CzcA; Cation efflux system protein CusA [uncultured Rubrobacteraceae bacterium]|uniref:Cobalt-zinc-cadmium resistance protein CzcA Cation efflux system protein CusA n=1 Tax=uncultured Rubrobacteraceae bacterium TaxID=349277 RepID=A0A6J4R4E6_9ACTN|nr:MAG: Cobalt-zinc-cadmium resistance protein CzcA; Cation efflux system protein CusA [uncultured Rubrobacteraceae bacterium]